jgi:hypothetical protein
MITYQGKANRVSKQTLKALRTISKESGRYYNELLDYSLELFRETNEVISANPLKKALPKPEDFSTYHSEPIVERVVATMQRYAKKEIKKPRSKNVQTSRWSLSSTIYLSQSQKVLISAKEKSAKIKVPGTDLTLKFRTDKREIKGTIKRVDLVKDSCGDLWVKLVTDHTESFKVGEASCEAIGVDLGCREYAVAVGTTYKGTRLKLGHDRPLEDIKKEQRKAEEAQKKKDWRGLKHISRRVQRKRKDYNHVLACKLVRSAKRTYIGDVSSKFLFSNPSSKVARQAGDASHGQLRAFVGQKAQRATEPREAYLVYEAYTSQTCFPCRTRNKVGSLKFWTCHYCRTWHDRDVNAGTWMPFCEIKKDLCRPYRIKEEKYKKMRAQRSKPRVKRQAMMPVGEKWNTCMEPGIASLASP